jgi:RimJ/RimL family protein N-acetyltransferase
MSSLWDRVLCHFIVQRNGTEVVRIGYVSIYNADLMSRTAFFSGISAPPWFRSGLVFDALALLFGYAFSAFDLRKLYAELADNNFEQFQSGVGRLFTEEARLRDFVFRDGRYRDLVYLSITREHWDELAARIMPHVSVRARPGARM